MSNIVAANEFSGEQLSLIKSTVAKGATDDELKLFLYRCKNMGLDPLKPGQVHFVKYGTNPGSIIVGIEGLRSKAARTGKLGGIKRGVLRDENGKCVGGWCEVYRTDWSHPAREEVSLNEYSTGRNLWQSKPETMIKKVAEVAALRMAFPDDFSGLYIEEEHQKTEERAVQAKELTTFVQDTKEAPEFEAADYFETPENNEVESSLEEFVFQVGQKNKGKKLKDIPSKDLGAFVAWVDSQDPKTISEEMKIHHTAVVEYLIDRESAKGEG